MCAEISFLIKGRNNGLRAPFKFKWENSYRLVVEGYLLPKRVFGAHRIIVVVVVVLLIVLLLQFIKAFPCQDTKWHRYQKKKEKPEEKRKKGLIFFGQCVTTETGVLLIMQEFRQLRAINSQWWRRPSFPSSLIDKVCFHWIQFE